MNKIILSYCRVSTSEQSTDGAGLDNQKYVNNKAIKQLQDNNNYSRLDDIIEVGSAYKGNNLLTIVDNAKNGLYPKDSIIVMFDQSRFSRTDFLESANKMKELLNTGVKVHYSSTNETLTSEKLEDFGGFISMLAKAEAANKESQSRSYRTTASYNKKIAANELVVVGHIPSWLRKIYDTSGSKPIISGFEIIEERKKTIEIIFKKYVSGIGATSITGWLNQNEEPWDNFSYRRKNKEQPVWRESYITKILVNTAIIGERVFNVGKENESIRSDYYPAVVSKSLWYQAQQIRKDRPKGTTGGYKHPVNIFSGLCFCGYCGGRSGIQNYNTGRSPAIRCTAYAKNEISKDICAGGASKTKYLEKVLIEFCKDKINYNFIFKKSNADLTELKMNAEGLRVELEKLNNRLTKIEDLYLNDEITKNRYLLRKSEFDDSFKNKTIQLLTLNAKIEANTHNTTTDEVEFLKLLEMIKKNNIANDIRLKLRDLLPQFISRIDIYRYGSGWVSPNKLKEFKALLEGQNVKDVITHFESRTQKSRTEISYGIYFKNGYFRVINFDVKKDTWSSMSDNEGVLCKLNSDLAK